MSTTQPQLPAHAPLTPQDETALIPRLLAAASNALTLSNNSPTTTGPYTSTASAAVLSASGTITTGLNIFHFVGGPCAEQACFGAAAANGSGVLSHVVCVIKGGRVINPCGKCRQIMLDLYPGIRVVVTTGEVEGGQELRVVGVRELLPWAYETTVGKERTET